MNAPIDISDVVLYTERLTLRPFRPSDVEDLYAYASVDGVGQMAGWLPHKTTADSAEILARFIQGKKTFAIEYNGKCIGSVGIELYNEEMNSEYAALQCREIGYVLSKDYWGRGIMPEAVQAVLAYLFREVGLDAVFCGNFLHNTRSARVQEKCGFRMIGYGTYETRFHTIEQTVERVLLRSEWESRNKA